MAAPTHCVDTLGAEREERVGLYPCKGKLVNPGYRQTYKLRHYRDISIEMSNSDCLDFNHGKILSFPCKFKQENQYFRYDPDTKQIICGPKRDKNCMDMDPKEKTLFYSRCNANKITQKWNWGFTNETMLRNWVEYGKAILNKTELMDMRELAKNLKQSL